MMRHYTERELIERIRRARGLAVLGHESWCASDEHIDARIAEELRVWYARLLRTAPAERLPVRDLKEQVQECRFMRQGAEPSAGSAILCGAAPWQTRWLYWTGMCLLSMAWKHPSAMRCRRTPGRVWNVCL